MGDNGTFTTAEHAWRRAIKSGVPLTTGKEGDSPTLTTVPFISTVLADMVAVVFEFIST